MSLRRSARSGLRQEQRVGLGVAGGTGERPPPAGERSEWALFRGDRVRREIDAQRLRHAGAIRGMGFGAVDDMALLDFDARVTHGAGGVLEENPLLLGGHLPEQDAGLLIVVVVDAMIPVRRI